MCLEMVDTKSSADSVRAWKMTYVGWEAVWPPVCAVSHGPYSPGWNWVSPRWIWVSIHCRGDIQSRWGQCYPRGFHAWLTPEPPWDRIKIHGLLIPVWLAGIRATGTEYEAPVAVAEAMYIDPEVYRRALAGQPMSSQ